MSDARFLLLQQWLQQSLGAMPALMLISGDASFRRYYRVQLGQAHYILADSPPEKMDSQPFLALVQSYRDSGVPVPEIIAADATLGCILQQDLGDVSLLSQLQQQNVTAYYRQALQLLPAISRVRQSSLGPLPVYDAEFVWRELQIFREWLLGVHWQLSLSDTEQQLLQQSFALLVDNALEQPKVGMHRDFHSRNLMLHQQRLWVIDFQDAVLGPVTYDAVSLLRDCYVRWPDELVSQLRHEYFQLCQQQQLIPATVTAAQFERWFDLMGIQRHLKAAGIFARLLHRDGKSGYIKDIPLTLGYVADICDRYPELAALGRWVRQQLLPRLGAHT